MADEHTRNPRAGVGGDAGSDSEFSDWAAPGRRRRSAPLPDPFSQPPTPDHAEAGLPPGADPYAHTLIARRRREPRLWVNAALFALTLASVLYWGFIQYQSFYLGDLVFSPWERPAAFFGGLPFGLAVIAFLASHEMGHYLACRFYGIRATLPYFIPIPTLIPTPWGVLPIAPLLPGTMGAVIRIIAPITSRRALFDIAIAGPIAGFVVALPILAVGLSQCEVVTQYEIQSGATFSMGEPLIWSALASVFGPETGPNEDLLMHPLAYVGWFAMLVTAMNLLPVGQLDGGHLLYSFLPRNHRWISVAVLFTMVIIGFTYFAGWVVFAAIIFFVLGIRHPRPRHVDQALGPVRVVLAAVALAIFVTSFILVPVSINLPG